ISQQIVTKNRKVIFFMIEKLNENASLSDLITTFENVKDELQIGKNNIAGTLGSPFVGTDKLSVTKTKIQTLKNTLAISLSMKNISAQSTETLHSLIGKVAGIANIFIAQGECTQVGEKTFQLYQVDNNTPKTCSANAISFNLAFTPKFIIVYRNAYNIGLCSFVFYSSFRNIITAVPQPSNFGEMYMPNTFDCVVGHTCILPVKDYKIPHFFYAIA
ncbi:hypothetical protein, partial [Clostridioides difficile]